MDNQEIINTCSRRKLALGNAKADAVVVAALSPYGYDAAKLDQGLQLIADVDDLANVQGTEYGEQLEATKTFYDSWAAIKKKYNRAVAIARIEFDDDTAARVALKLDGRRKNGVAGWIVQATAFYKGLRDNAAWLAKMAGFDLTRVNADLAQVEQIGELDRQQEKETGEAREATKARDEKFDELNAWWSRYVAYAELALEDQPQKLKLVTEGEI